MSLSGMQTSDENVVVRLRRKIRQAKQQGFRVRSEYLEDQQATWCEIGGVKTLFIDLSQTADQQLLQLEESLASFAQQHSSSDQTSSRAA